MSRATLVLGLLTLGLGAAVVVRTAAAGGGAVAFGYVFGGGLLLAGALRLYLAMSRSAAERNGQGAKRRG